MTIRHVFGAAAAALVLVAAAANAQPPVEAFGNLPAVESPVLSPDGKRYAIVQSHDGKPIVTIVDLETPAGTPPLKLGAGDGRVATMMWANNNHVIVILKANLRVSGDNRVRTWWRAISVDVQKKTAAIMLNNVPSMRYNSGAAYVADLALNDPDHVYMPLIDVNNAGRLVLDLYKVDVNNGAGELANPGIMWTSGWIMDGNGNVVIRVDNYATDFKMHIKVPAGHDWREIGVFDMKAGGDMHALGITEDGKGLVIDAGTSARHVGLYRVDLSTLAQTPLYSNPDYDVMGPLQDEWTGRIIGAVVTSDRIQYVYFDGQRQKLQAALERAFPGLSVAIASCDTARAKCIVRVTGPRHPPGYYLLDVATLHAAEIGSAYPDLAEADLGEMRPYSYAARDGLTIPGYLTLPPGREAKNLPLVVMPHGGPEARDYLTFDWWAQFLANRGYAVFQPNFRGSTGYGLDFLHAGFHEWGLKMQDDLSDGVAKLVADGVADPKRVCIVGASYGGYAALAGAAFSPDLYACAVSVAGVGDLDDMLHTEELDTGRESVAVSYWASRIGDRHSSADSARIVATSPAQHADAIKVPVLLMHAKGDTTVRIAQSRDMRDALTRAHKPVTYIELEGDDHYLDLAATRIRVLSEIEKFLAANIGR